MSPRILKTALPPLAIKCPEPRAKTKYPSEVETPLHSWPVKVCNLTLVKSAGFKVPPFIKVKRFTVPPSVAVVSLNSESCACFWPTVGSDNEPDLAIVTVPDDAPDTVKLLPFKGVPEPV